MASLAETLAAAVSDPSLLPKRHRLPRSAAAIHAIQPPLTPQEMNLYYHHLHNMQPGRWIDQGNGTVSTVIQKNEDAGDWGGVPGTPTNFPSVWNGKELKGDALWNAIQPMSQWPPYPSYEAGDRRYLDQMHPAMELDAMPPDAYHQYRLNRQR